MIKNIFKLKNLYILITLAGIAYGGFYFGTQNTDTTSSNKTLELTTVAIKKGDLEKKEELRIGADMLFEKVKLGNIKINIFKKYRLDDVVQAHKDLEARKIIGPAIIVP